jgi:hypothetical protein
MASWSDLPVFLVLIVALAAVTLLVSPLEGVAIRALVLVFVAKLRVVAVLGFLVAVIVVWSGRVPSSVVGHAGVQAVLQTVLVCRVAIQDIRAPDTTVVALAPFVVILIAVATPVLISLALHLVIAIPVADAVAILVATIDDLSVMITVLRLYSILPFVLLRLSSGQAGYSQAADGDTQNHDAHGRPWLPAHRFILRLNRKGQMRGAADPLAACSGLAACGTEVLGLQKFTFATETMRPRNGSN